MIEITYLDAVKLRSGRWPLSLIRSLRSPSRPAWLEWRIITQLKSWLIKARDLNYQGTWWRRLLFPDEAGFDKVWLRIKEKIMAANTCNIWTRNKRRIGAHTFGPLRPCRMQGLSILTSISRRTLSEDDKIVKMDGMKIQPASAFGMRSSRPCFLKKTVKSSSS